MIDLRQQLLLAESPLKIAKDPFSFAMRLVHEGVKIAHAERLQGNVATFIGDLKHGSNHRETLIIAGPVKVYEAETDFRGRPQGAVKTNNLVDPMYVRMTSERQTAFEIRNLRTPFAEKSDFTYPTLSLNPHHKNLHDWVDSGPWGKLQQSDLARRVAAEHKDCGVLLFGPGGSAPFKHLVMVIPQNTAVYKASSEFGPAPTSLGVLGYTEFQRRSVYYQYEHSIPKDSQPLPVFPWMELSTQQNGSTGIIIGIPPVVDNKAQMILGFPNEEYADRAALSLHQALKNPEANGLANFEGPFRDQNLHLRVDAASTAPYTFLRYSGTPEELGKILERVHAIADREPGRSLHVSGLPRMELVE